MKKFIPQFLSFLLIILLTFSILNVGQAKGVEPTLTHHYSNKVLVLNYHHLSKEQVGSSITPEQFRSHMRSLKSNGYHVISIEDFFAFEKYGKPVPKNAVVLTFDDGYESFYLEAYPVLKAYGYTATNFLIVKSTDIYNPLALPHLSWDEIHEMKRNGYSFYSHTYNLHSVGHKNIAGEAIPLLQGPIYLSDEGRTETQHEYEKRITDDLQYAESRLTKELGNQFHFLCFPYGASSESAVRIGKELGIQLFFTTNQGINGPNQVMINRISSDGISAEELLEKMQKYDSAGATSKSKNVEKLKDRKSIPLFNRKNF